MSHEYGDFEHWLTERAIRRGGKPPAERTLVGYTMRLRGAQRIGGFASAQLLAGCLGDRVAWCSLLDKLYAQQATVTVSGVVQALKQYGEFAVAKGLIAVSEVRKEDAPSHVPQKPIEVLTENEVAKLLLYAEARGNFRFYALLATLSETACRISEALALTYDDLKLETEVPHFDLRKTKRGRQHLLPLSKFLRDEIWTPQNIERLKKSHANEKMRRDSAAYPFPWTYKGASHHLKRLLEAAGLPSSPSFHVFRHTRATQLLARGVPLHVVSSLLNHSNVAVTQRTYDHTDALSFARYLD